MRPAAGRLLVGVTIPSPYERAPAYDRPIPIPDGLDLPQRWTPIAQRAGAAWAELPEAWLGIGEARKLAKGGRLLMATCHAGNAERLVIHAVGAKEPPPRSTTARRFPVLADQVRCSSGVTFVAGGVMRALAPVARVVAVPHKGRVS